jgi:DNA-binding MarR family transcriptional regulator
MRNDIFERVAVDLLSIPPLIFRGIRRKLIRTTLADIPVDITPIHFEIVRLLKEEGTLHVAEIGERLQIAKAQMTQLIDRLVDLDMVERKFDSADRRIINVTLTNEGSTVLEEHKNNIMNAIRETMSGLTDAELEDLSDSLRKLRDILSKLQ